jgi:hypothetical protein
LIEIEGDGRCDAARRSDYHRERGLGPLDELRILIPPGEPLRLSPKTYVCDVGGVATDETGKTAPGPLERYIAAQDTC